ncbi:MAG: AzlC family ABC transporter permease [Treponema sp.]|jgi:4-azaleucine resistance transporter AzlC|nr:AzlC family ABC transporter permease [Treponema sp.]
MKEPVGHTRANRQQGLGTFTAALRYSFPVFLGYIAIGVAFGLLLVDAGYPWWMAPLMGVIMYAGAGQYLAVGLFAAGAGLAEAVLLQFILNARHIAYGITLGRRINASGPFKFYLIYALTDETFALLSSLPDGDGPGETGARPSFMFLVALLDHSYWVAGSVAGAVAGTLLPFDMDGIGFALTALFIVLMMEQMFRIRRPAPFVISGLAAALASFLLPSRFSLLTALAVSLAAVQLFPGRGPDNRGPGLPDTGGAS